MVARERKLKVKDVQVRGWRGGWTTVGGNAGDGENSERNVHVTRKGGGVKIAVLEFTYRTCRRRTRIRVTIKSINQP